jgi:DNA-binding beta-propeller fold protein YncE
MTQWRKLLFMTIMKNKFRGRLQGGILMYGRDGLRGKAGCIILGFVFIIALMSTYAAEANPMGAEILKMDSSNLSSPGRTSVGADGTLYVADSYSNRVVKIDQSGSVAGYIPCLNISAVAVANDGTLYMGSHRDYSVVIYRNGKVAGHLGEGANEFLSIRDIAIDGSNGDVYVTDNVANVVKVFDSAGNPKKVLAGFNIPVAVAIKNGLVYILDAPIVPSADDEGTTTGSRVSIVDGNGKLVRSIEELAPGDGQMARPTDIAVDLLGNIYITDSGRRAVLVYDSGGIYVGSMVSMEGSDDINVAVSLSFAPDGRLYVSSCGTNTIMEVGVNGNTVAGSKNYVEFFNAISGAGLTPASLGY